MPRAYLAIGQLEERSALRLMLQDLGMEISGEAGDWSQTVAEAPASHADILLVDWGLLSRAEVGALDLLRTDCPSLLIIILIPDVVARPLLAASIGVEEFISRGEMPERVAEQMRAVAARVPVQ